MEVCQKCPVPALDAETRVFLTYRLPPLLINNHRSEPCWDWHPFHSLGLAMPNGSLGTQYL